jgi:hypothetical protein
VTTTVVYTCRAREIISNAINGTTVTIPKYLAWGTNAVATTAANTDIAMWTEAAESRTTGTPSITTTNTTNDTFSAVGTITSLSGQTITESGLSTTSAKPQSTTLSAAITTTTATSMTVTSASGFPGSGNYYVQIDSEVVEVTGGQGTTTWTIVRHANGSTAATHLISAAVTGGNIPGGAGVITSGDLFMHSSYTGLALNTGDALTGTFNLYFS